MSLRLALATLAALLRLTRPHNVLAAALCTLFGAHVVLDRDEPRDWPSLLLPALAVCLVVGAVNCLNDVVDHVEDGHNAPHRPIPSGSVGRAAASGFALALLGAAGAIALRLDQSVAAMGVLLTAAGVAYAVRIKRTVLLGNLLVGVLSGATLLFGARAVNGTLSSEVWTAFGLVSLFVFAREVLKSIADHDGDRRAGHVTTATRLGHTRAMRVFRIIVLMFAIASLVPWLAQVVGFPYLLAVTICGTLPLCAIAATPRLAPDTMRRWLRATKLSWFAGMAGLLLVR